jgi:hypothetical protein
MEQKKLVVIDPKPIPKYALDVPYKAYAIPIVGFRLHFQSAFRQLNPNAWVDVQHSNLSVQKGLRKTLTGKTTSNLNFA